MKALLSALLAAALLTATLPAQAADDRLDRLQRGARVMLANAAAGAGWIPRAFIAMLLEHYPQALPGEPLDEATWRASEDYRPGLAYRPGLTPWGARYLAREVDTVQRLKQTNWDYSGSGWVKAGVYLGGAADPLAILALLWLLWYLRRRIVDARLRRQEQAAHAELEQAYAAAEPVPFGAAPAEPQQFAAEQETAVQAPAPMPTTQRREPTLNLEEPGSEPQPPTLEEPVITGLPSEPGAPTQESHGAEFARPATASEEPPATETSEPEHDAGPAEEQAGETQREAAPQPAPGAEDNRVADLRRRAEAGESEAQLALSRAYQRGEGVAPDPQRAGQWLARAAETGDAVAQHRLARRLFHGTGMARDEPAAARWLEEAAGQGRVEAKVDLATLHAQGRGVERDPRRALRLLQEAAEQGDEAACELLATAHAEGWLGLPADPEQAQRWRSRTDSDRPPPGRGD